MLEKEEALVPPDSLIYNLEALGTQTNSQVYSRLCLCNLIKIRGKWREGRKQHEWMTPYMAGSAYGWVLKTLLEKYYLTHFYHSEVQELGKVTCHGTFMIPIWGVSFNLFLAVDVYRQHAVEGKIAKHVLKKSFHCHHPIFPAIPIKFFCYLSISITTNVNWPVDPVCRPI